MFKKNKFMDTDNSVVIEGAGGWVEVEEGMRGLLVMEKLQ